MEKLLFIICVFCSMPLLSSCSLIKGVNDGIVIVKGVNDGKAVVKSKIEEIQNEDRLTNQGFHISNNSTSSASNGNSTNSDNGWYKCCAEIASVSNATYHVCSNCGLKHKSASGHMCKKK